MNILRETVQTPGAVHAHWYLDVIELFFHQIVIIWRQFTRPESS